MSESCAKESVFSHSGHAVDADRLPVQHLSKASSAIIFNLSLGKKTNSGQ